MSVPIELTRHELLWVVERCGGDGWPYPLRRPHWPAETGEETGRHRARVEAGLRGRGLLAPAPAAFLTTIGELVRDWCLALDVVVRTATAADGIPRAVVAVSDGRRAVVLASADAGCAPVRVTPARPDRLPEEVVAVVGAAPAGTGPTVGVTAHALDDPAGTVSGVPAGTPRAMAARERARRLLDTASAWGLAGAAVRPPTAPGRPPAAPQRREPLVLWLDGPHGRHRVVHDRRGRPARTLIAPVDTAEITADLHRLVGGPPATTGGGSA